jgi:uncharacterized protein
VTNITKFGAFVNIGIKQDGMVHISQMSTNFIRDPNEVVKLGQRVIVAVTEVDINRNRVALSMKGEKQTMSESPKKERSPESNNAKKENYQNELQEKLAKLINKT